MFASTPTASLSGLNVTDSIDRRSNFNLETAALLGSPATMRTTAAGFR